jgi:hypothetical protein
VADPSNVIADFEISASSPEASEITPRYIQENSSDRIGWIVEWDNPTNATVQLPINTSKETGTYRYSLVATSSGSQKSIERQINITE